MFEDELRRANAERERSFDETLDFVRKQRRASVRNGSGDSDDKRGRVLSAAERRMEKKRQIEESSKKKVGRWSTQSSYFSALTSPLTSIWPNRDVREKANDRDYFSAKQKKTPAKKKNDVIVIDDDSEVSDDCQIVSSSTSKKSLACIFTDTKKNRRCIRRHSVDNIHCIGIYAGPKLLGPGTLCLKAEEQCLKFEFMVSRLENKESKEICLVPFSALQTFYIIDISDNPFLAIRSHEKLTPVEDYYDHQAEIGAPNAFIIFELSRTDLEDKIMNTFLAKQQPSSFEIDHDDAVLYRVYQRGLREKSEDFDTKCLAGVKVADCGQPEALFRQEANLMKRRRHDLYSREDDELLEDKYIKSIKKRGPSQRIDMTSTKKKTRAEKEATIAFIYPPEASVDAIQLTLADRDRLEEGEFLNDSLINCMLKHSFSDCSFQSSLHIFSSFFFTKMIQAEQADDTKRKMEYAVDAVRRWTKHLGTKLFEKDMLFFPINENLHWSLAVIMYPGAEPVQHIPVDLTDNDEATDVSTNEKSMQEDYRAPCILVLDSLRCHDEIKIAKYLRAFLNAQYSSYHDDHDTTNDDDNNTHKPKRFNKKNMPVIAMENIPKQTNSYDCGVYLLEYAATILKRGLALEPPLSGTREPKPKLLGEGPPFSQNLFEEYDIREKRAEFRRFFDEHKGHYEKADNTETPPHAKRPRTSSEHSQAPAVVLLSGPPPLPPALPHVDTCEDQDEDDCIILDNKEPSDNIEEQPVPPRPEVIEIDDDDNKEKLDCDEETEQQDEATEDDDNTISDYSLSLPLPPSPPHPSTTKPSRLQHTLRRSSRHTATPLVNYKEGESSDEDDPDL